VSTLLPVFEQCLSDAPATASYDALRHSVVILMGTLAKHLDADNPKVRPIVGLLIETLSTPSQQVLYFTFYYNAMSPGPKLGPLFYIVIPHLEICACDWSKSHHVKCTKSN